MAGPWEAYQSQTPSGPWQRYGTQVKQAPPGYQTLGPKAEAELQQTQLGVEKTRGTLAADEQTAKAQAKSAQIKANQDQEQWNISHPSANGTEGLSGPAYMQFLQKTDPGRAAYIQGLAEGRVPFPGAQMMRSPAGQALLTQVMRADPTMDATNYATRAAERKNAATGQLSQSDNALVTAVGHAARLHSLVPDVFGSTVTPFNSIANTVQGGLLGGKQPAYDQNAQLLGDEVAKAYGGSAQGDREGAAGQFSSSLATSQKNDNIRGAIDLMLSKLAANRAQFAYGNGGLGKPDFMLLPPNVRDELQNAGASDLAKKYFSGVPVMGSNGGIEPPGGGQAASGGSSAPPPIGPAGMPPGSPPTADYSGMVGGPGSTVATMDPNSKLGAFAQTYRSVYDPVAASTVSAFIRKGEPYATAADYAQSHGLPAPNEKDYNDAVTFAAQHHGATNVRASRDVPTTLGERLASSPASAFLAGGAAGATAGLSDVAGRTIAGKAWDANRQALSATHGTADLLGNVAGGLAGTYFGGGALGKVFPKAAQTLGDLAEAHPVLTGAGTGMGQGALYGADENPNNPLGGAVMGGTLGAITGGAGSATARSLGSMIAPTGGALRPLWEANPAFRPTIGQRLSASKGLFSRALGAGEQAAESIPITGGIQSAARGAATDQMQLGAFNHALGEIGQQLPSDVVKGPQAHAFMQDKLGQAQNDARSQMQFAADPQYATELGAWQRSPSSMALTSDQVDHVHRVIKSALDGRVNGNVMTGPSYAAAASDLGRVARQWSGNPATAGQAAYLRDFSDIMDSAALRASPPEAGQALAAANRGYAKGVIIENAARSAGGPPTEFTGKQLLRSVQNSDDSVRDRTFLQGQGLMQDYATAANQLSPSLADSGTPQRLAWMNLAGGAEAGAGLAAAAYGGHPAVLAPWAVNTLANLPGARKVVGAAMAPREFTLPPSLANPLNVTGRNLKDLAPTIGNAAVPGTLAWYANQ